MTRCRSAIPALNFVFLCAGAALAQVGQTGSFVQVPGSLSQISVGADGAVWGVDPNQNIFTYDAGSGRFVQIPGALTQIAVGNANAVWGINAQGLIFEWNAAQQTWTYIPGNLSQIAVGADGDVWGINMGGQVWHYNQQAQTWDTFDNPFGTLQVAVGNDGSVYFIFNDPGFYPPGWYNPGTGQLQNVIGETAYGAFTVAVGADGDLWGAGTSEVVHFNSWKAEWDVIPSNGITQLAVGSGANVWGLATNPYIPYPLDGAIFHWDAQSATWVQVPGALSQIAAGADGSVWGINSLHQVFRYVGPTQPYHTLIQIPGSFKQISVSLDGTAGAVDVNNLVYAFDRGTQTFQNVPGQSLTQVSVGQPGNVWGVSPGGGVWQWGAPAADTWSNVPGELNQLGVSAIGFSQGGNSPFIANGTVFGINQYGQTYMYVNGYPYTSLPAGWIEIPGALTQLSVASDGTVWGINQQQQIYFYQFQAPTDTTPAMYSWVNVPGSLVEISAGSANNIWGVNYAQQVYRYDTTAQAWVNIRGGALTQIAAGFDGAVWGVNAQGELYQWDSAAQSFNVVGSGVTNVAVGNDNLVFAWNADTGATYYWF